jgi:hypothetical protein
LCSHCAILCIHVHVFPLLESSVTTPMPIIPAIALQTVGAVMARPPRSIIVVDSCTATAATSSVTIPPVTTTRGAAAALPAAANPPVAYEQELRRRAHQHDIGVVQRPQVGGMWPALLPAVTAVTSATTMRCRAVLRRLTHMDVSAAVSRAVSLDGRAALTAAAAVKLPAALINRRSVVTAAVSTARNTHGQRRRHHRWSR